VLREITFRAASGRLRSGLWSPVRLETRAAALAVVVVVCSLGVLVLHRLELPLIGRSLSAT